MFYSAVPYEWDFCYYFYTLLFLLVSICVLYSGWLLIVFSCVVLTIFSTGSCSVYDFTRNKSYVNVKITQNRYCFCVSWLLWILKLSICSYILNQIVDLTDIDQTVFFVIFQKLSVILSLYCLSFPITVYTMLSVRSSVHLSLPQHSKS